MPSSFLPICTRSAVKVAVKAVQSKLRYDLGKTSVVEGLNTKWRQRQSGLVRKSCDVCWRILDDIWERFLILADQHNREKIRQWNKTQESPLESP